MLLQAASHRIRGREGLPGESRGIPQVRGALSEVVASAKTVIYPRGEEIPELV